MHHHTTFSVLAIGLIAGCIDARQSDPPKDLPVVRVTADDTRIARSCRVEIADDAVIVDANGNGVIHIVEDGITVEFGDGALLSGAQKQTLRSELTGCGVRIEGHKNVTLIRPRVTGYKCGIHATRADGLTIDNGNAFGMFGQHLKSDTRGEDGADWLWPHNNDANEWLNNYGAAVYIEDSSGVTVTDLLVRDSQNGLVLDRVNDSKVFDNDCSFLSGWGLAMWRSSGNMVSRNAFDFCIRGYSHGVYNRGQDSAGILMFEQCNRNVFVENSATHGGDGFFAFGGREALGEAAAPAGFDHARKGCNGNVFVANDFSYAAAHGLELTFSFDNVIVNNRFAGNAICGIWGGYSQDTLIAGNRFENNGEMAYGLERGGINIEHGANNRIIDNTFIGDRVAIHLWSDDDGGLLSTPWAKANHKGCTDNTIARNTIKGGPLGIQLREASATTLARNTFEAVDKEVVAVDGDQPIVADDADSKWEAPAVQPLGDNTPTRARAELAGRQHIILNDWGPWDHVAPFVRLAKVEDGVDWWELYGLKQGIGYRVDAQLDGVSGGLAKPEYRGGPRRLLIGPRWPGVTGYRLYFFGGPLHETHAGTVVAIDWDMRYFPWTDATDPRKDVDAWRALAEGPGSYRIGRRNMDYRFGSGGPKDAFTDDPDIAGRFPHSDRFGMLATSTFRMPKGTWTVRLRSDDGVRLIFDGKTIIENWTHHAPTTDEATVTFAEDTDVQAVLEYFEIDGHAELSIDFEGEPVPIVWNKDRVKDGAGAPDAARPPQ